MYENFRFFNGFLFVGILIGLLVMYIRMAYLAAQSDEQDDDTYTEQDHALSSKDMCDTYFPKDSMIYAVSAEIGLIPGWLLKYNPTVVVIPFPQIIVTLNGMDYIAVNGDYIVEDHGRLSVMAHDEFQKKYLPVKRLRSNEEL